MGIGTDVTGSVMAVQGIDGGRGAGSPGEVLVRVAAMTRPKSGHDLGGLPRRMPRAQANLAAACVTAMGERLLVNPAQACIGAGLRASANNCYDFHLTAAEAASPRTVVRDKPVNGTLDNYRAIAVEMARLANDAGRDVRAADLLDELAAAVRDYLARFVPRLSRGDLDEVGEALGALGDHLSRRQAAPDGTNVDLPAYWRAAGAAGLAYHPGLRAMVPVADAPFGADRPFVPVGWRWAGAGRVACTDTSGAALGAVPAEFLYDIRLAACPGRGGAAEMRFLLEAWTILPAGPRAAASGTGPDADGLLYRPAVTARGFPVRPLRAREGREAFVMTLDGPAPGGLSGLRFDAGDAVVPGTAEGCATVYGKAGRSGRDGPGGFLDMPTGWAGHGDPIGRCATPAGLCERLYRGGKDAVEGMILARAAAMSAALARYDGGGGREAFLRRMRA